VIVGHNIHNKRREKAKYSYLAKTAWPPSLLREVLIDV